VDDRTAALVRELAAEFGVATEFWDWRGEQVQVDAETLRAVLAAFDVDCSDEAGLRSALAARRSRSWRSLLPPYLTLRVGSPHTVEVHLPVGISAHLSLELEDGSARTLQLAPTGARRTIDGREIAAGRVDLPGDIPAGYHRLVARADGSETSATVLAAPPWLGVPARLGKRNTWGLAVQLYSVRSRQSWGVGDLADLADLSAWAGAEHGAGFVLINPVHAAEPLPPLNPSPYLPTTRRFANPLYLRVERVPEYAELDEADRSAIARLRQRTDNASEQIERDRSWSAKREALEVLFRAGRSPGRDIAFRAFCRREGTALDRFAAWCVLVEEHGADWHDWPAELRHPDAPAVAEFAARQAARLDFHRWLQWLLDEQLAAAQQTSRSCGMSLGVVHDLAVGVSARGADSWSYQDELARGITVGAPPDAYAQTGQDWEQPPWRPDRLGELAYAPLREMIANVLRHAGGLRVDHILGLFRLWWIPAGRTPTDGTYIYYDHDAAIAVLMIEAARAEAVVIGEDLGTVEPWVREYLAERGILGTSVLWFERDWEGDGAPFAPEKWREYSLASVTTHDLPPTPAYLAGDHVRLRHELGLLTRPLDEELAADRADQQAWLDLLRERGLLSDDADEQDRITALHRALLAAPARLRSLSLPDAVGERRTQNQPGTRDEYPNWRVPLGGPGGEPVYLEDIFGSERAAASAEVIRGTA
jgi:4-alpha-glucanotransferase